MAKLRWWATRDEDGKRALFNGSKPRKLDSGQWVAKMGAVAMEGDDDWTSSPIAPAEIFPAHVDYGQCVEIEPPERWKVKA